MADLTFSSCATCARSAVENPQNGAQAATESSDPRCSQVAAVTWSEYRQMEAKAVRLEEEAEKAAGKRDALRARNKVAMQEQQKRIGQLEGWLQEQGEKAEERVAALKARVEEMEQDKKAVQQQWGLWERIAAVELASEKERAAGLQTRVGKAEERVAELQARAGKAEEKGAELQARVEKAEESAEWFKTQAYRLDDENSAFRKSLKEAEEDYDKRTAEVNRLFFLLPQAEQDRQWALRETGRGHVKV